MSLMSVRVAYALTHPIQYQSPLIRYFRQHGVDLQVIYATDITAGKYNDAGFGSAVHWDLPLLDGYEYSVLKPQSQIPTGMSGVAEFKSLIVAKLKEIRADVVWAHGWGSAYSLATISAAKAVGKPLMLRGETHLNSLRGKNSFRRFLHRQFIRLVVQRADALLAVGTANRQFYLAHGAKPYRIFTVPYVVDNDRFQRLSAEMQSRVQAIRQELGIQPDQKIVLFCGKLIDVKDPATLIRAVGQVQACSPILLMIGEGKLRPELELLANSVSPGRVKFLGFKNQTELPAFYSLCDQLVIPSVFEPWGLVVNEVMNAGKPVIASSCVGAAQDLISPSVNGDLFSAGNVGELAQKIESWLVDRERLKAGAAASLARINQWSFRQALDGLTEAVQHLSV